MEDRAAKRMDLVATVFTFVTFTVSDSVVAGVDDATVGASRQIAVGLLKQVVQASTIIWKAFVELFDRECLAHISSLLQRLHVVKG